MGFIVPNVADAFHAHQAELDAIDFRILAAAHRGFGVISGLDIVQDTGANMNVKVNTAGVGRVNGLIEKLAAGATATIGTADATHPRFDLVCLGVSNTMTIAAGTPAASPVFPAIPADKTVLAVVYVPAGDTAITTAQIIDKRMLIGDRPLIVDRSTTPTGVASNTTAETTLYTYTVKANTLGTDRAIRLNIRGTFRIETSCTLTLRIKFGATTMWADVTPSRTAVAGVIGSWMLDVTLQASGATNSQKLGGDLYLGNLIAATNGNGDMSQAEGAAGNLANSCAPYGTAAIDSTADAAFVVTVQMSAGNASSTFQAQMATLELLPS